MCSLIDERHLTVWSGYSSNDADNVAGDVVHVLDLAATGGIWRAVQQDAVRPSDRDGGHMCSQRFADGSGPLLVAGLSNDQSRTNDVWRLNPTSFKYEVVQRNVLQPPARSGHSSVAVGRKMVVLFGEGPAGLLGDVWAFDVDTEQWEQLSSSCPFGGRVGATALAQASSIWVVGGRLADGKATMEILFFDIVRRTWSLEASSGAPAGRYWHSAALVDRAILVVAGTTDTASRTSEMYMFEPFTGTWSTVRQLPAPISIRRGDQHDVQRVRG